jgi:hypothetical protein
MREFCENIQPPGTTIVNLLLNERDSGERFWNLLRMQYVKIEDRTYIFGVQTSLDAYMPRLLMKSMQKRSDEKNQRIVEVLQPFIEKLEVVRREVRDMTDAPFMQCKGYFTCAMNYLPRMPMLRTTGEPPAINAKDETELSMKNITVGATVVAEAGITYKGSLIPKGSKGTISSVDSFGSAVIQWTQGYSGTATLLVKDFGKLAVSGSPTM